MKEKHPPAAEPPFPPPTPAPAPRKRREGESAPAWAPTPHVLPDSLLHSHLHALLHSAHPPAPEFHPAPHPAQALAGGSTHFRYTRAQVRQRLLPHFSLKAANQLQSPEAPQDQLHGWNHGWA